jgi:hypothetical protein
MVKEIRISKLEIIDNRSVAIADRMAGSGFHPNVPVERFYEPWSFDYILRQEYDIAGYLYTYDNGKTIDII